MLSSLPMYPQSIEDITQLMRIGVPSSLIATVSLLLVLMGLVWMILILPMAGVSRETPLINIRFMQMMISIGLALVMTVGHRSVFRLLDSISRKRPLYRVIAKNICTPKWSDVGLLTVATGAMVIILSFFSKSI